MKTSIALALLQGLAEKQLSEQTKKVLLEKDAQKKPLLQGQLKVKATPRPRNTISAPAA